MTQTTGAAWGVDGCKAGWFFFRLPSAGDITFGFVTKLRALFDPGVRTAKDKVADQDIATEGDLMLVDMPIGLPDDDDCQAVLRACDQEARDILRPRWQSVFPVPVKSVMENRYLLSAESWEKARPILAKRHPVPKNKKGRLTAQSFAILVKIKEVGDLLTSDRERGIIRETHPEICFMNLAMDSEQRNRLNVFSKKHGLGFVNRVAILDSCHPDAEEVIFNACERWPQIASDDIVDAMACAVTAWLIFHDKDSARALPHREPPRKDVADRSDPPEIVFAVPSKNLHDGKGS